MVRIVTIRKVHASCEGSHHYSTLTNCCSVGRQVQECWLLLLCQVKLKLWVSVKQFYFKMICNPKKKKKHCSVKLSDFQGLLIVTMSGFRTSTLVGESLSSLGRLNNNERGSLDLYTKPIIQNQRERYVPLYVQMRATYLVSS